MLHSGEMKLLLTHHVLSIYFWINCFQICGLEIMVQPVGQEDQAICAHWAFFREFVKD